MGDLLREVVRATAGVVDADLVLDRAARVLLARAEVVLADRLDEPDLVTRVAVHGRSGPLRLPEGDATAPGPLLRRSSAGSVGLLPSLARSPRRLLHLRADDLAELADAPEPHVARQVRTALDLGAEQLLLLGLVGRDTLLGVLTLVTRDRLGDEDLEELRDVALHVGLALDAARLLALQSAVATAMQTSLLPPLPLVDGLQLAARYQPAARGLDVGGDWYDAFPSQGGLVVVVGDVRGHDLAAAARMADLRNLLRAHAVDSADPPSVLLGRLDRTAEALGLEGTATCVAGRLVRRDGGWDLTWSSAGHLPPVLVTAGRARLLEPEADLMLGVETSSARTDHVHRLEPGDVLLLCTDGLAEVRGAGLGERLELLRRRVEESAAGTPDRLAELLLSTVAGTAEDDVALLVVQAV